MGYGVGVEPVGEGLGFQDTEGGLAGGGAAGSVLAGVEGVAEDVVAGYIEGETGEGLGVARQQGCERGVDVEAGVAKALHGLEAVRDGLAAGLKEAADAVVIGGEREADAEVGAFSDGLEEVGVAEDVGGAGLDDENFGRVEVDGFQNLGHEILGHFGGLVGVS